ncbi:HAD-IIIC family phosphatase, partial [Actinosynnema sp. NPDC023658]|uniref:HAD-IIIC family phosphatase n=1 Tax=Actinosynnema sp. NPDC023658 TaxID=3155465 RepID=UPI0033C77B12
NNHLAPRLLPHLTGPHLLRAVQRLARLDPDEVRRLHPSVPAVTVAVTGHGTVSGIVAPLTAELARHGLLLRPHVTDFDSYVLELADPDSALHRARPDLALCLLDATVVFDEVPTPWTAANVRQVLADKLRLLEKLVTRYGEINPSGGLVLNTLPLTRTHLAQLVDRRSRAGLGAAWREFNAGLLRLVERHPVLTVLDLDPLVAEGVRVTDPRLSTYAKAHLSADLLAACAREVGHLARERVGRTGKCLVLDLDGTLWGGVLGDDGVEGIEVAGGYRGEAFRAFQRVVKQLGSQGVLLAAVSKNDVEPVRQVLTRHPDMTLREDDLVRVTANWRPKSDNLVELAEALNLGVDSFVFADDSAFECEQVARELPGVTVIRLDDEPALHVEKLLRDGWFDVTELTTVDRGRVTKYREELERRDFLAGFDSVTDYLRELGIVADLSEVAERDVPRVAQLTLRTNQFNLTTRRLQPTEVAALRGDQDALVLGIRSADRFGDNGLVGAIFARRDGDLLHVDNVLLSCRVFARGIEQACLAALLRHARDTGTRAVLARYRPTAKNGKVADFFPRMGFTTVGEDDEGTAFRHDLVDIVDPPPHVTLTGTLGGTRS